MKPLLSKGKRKIFVFGEMKELGDYAIKGHGEIGKEIVKTEISHLFTIGDLTKHTIKSAIKGGMPSKNTYFAKNKEELLQKLTNVMKKDDVVLIKASRSMGLEEIVASLS
jgi:UDP-N-acetylmuramoyl-tripeptide--D-alanyl-D-alanine ligase